MHPVWNIRKDKNNNYKCHPKTVYILQAVHNDTVATSLKADSLQNNALRQLLKMYKCKRIRKCITINHSFIESVFDLTTKTVKRSHEGF